VSVRKIYLVLAIVVLCFGTVQAQKQGQELLDSLMKELPKAKEDTNHVKLLKNLSSNLFTTDPDKGIKYGLEGAKLGEEIGWEKGVASNYLAIGANYSYGKSDYTKGISYFEKALKIYEKLNLKSDIASTLGNLGFVYRNQSDYVRALNYYQRSLRIFEGLDKKEGIAANLGNIGIIYDYQGNFPLALEYYKKALKLNRELNNKSGVAALLTNIGLVYYFQADYANALDNLKKSQKIFDEMGNKSGTASTLGNIGLIYQTKGDYSDALENYNKAAGIYEELGIKANLATNLGNIGELYYTIAQDSVLKKLKTETDLVSLDRAVDIERSISNYNRAIKILEEIGELDTRSRFMKGLSNVYALRGDYDKALTIYKKYIELKDSVFNDKTKTQIANLEAIRGNEIRDRELKIKDLKIAQSENERLIALAGAIVFILIAVIIFRQRQRSEKLLLNILPLKIAKRLKKKERLIADDIECASIVFVDLVGFTAYSKDRKASDVLQMLNEVFNKVDGLIVKYGLEKIKTIGDGYMAAAGVPEPCADHSVRATNFALDVHIIIAELNKVRETDIRARVGIESGPIVAGVIGKMKFAYDLWGDSVNTASRMESTGKPGFVHISANTKRELESQTDAFEFEELEPMEVKGKGLMLTYMVSRKAGTGVS
jgi:class 3 adenylate cyclase/lipopolysaccharide biosynthesis regulator YciM